MTTHTPGPWTVGPQSVATVDGFKLHRFPISGSGQAIASVWNGSVGKEAVRFENQEANARLIAAAPELLELCETLLAECIGMIPYWGDDADHGAELLAKAEAAIAKARG